MRILSYQNIEVPSSSAHSIYMVRTCALLSREFPLTLVASRGSSAYGFEALYGFTPQARQGLTLRVPPFRHKGLSGLWRRAAAARWLRRHRDEGPVVHVSQAGPLRHFTRLKARRPFRLLLECHALAEFRRADLSAVDGVIYMGRSLRDDMVRRFPALEAVPELVSFHRVEEVPAPPGAECFTPRPDGSFTLCYVGSLLDWKGLETAIDALAALPERLRLLLVGSAADPAYGRSLVERAEAAGVARRVEFAGFVPPARVADAVRRADAFLLPLKDEEQGSVPMKLVEYLGWGRPVLASDLPSIADIIENGRSGLLVRPGSVEALRDGATALAAMPPEARRALVVAGLETLERYRADLWLAETADWLRRVFGP